MNIEGITKNKRRTLLAGAAASLLARPLLASPWPSRPIRIIVPFAAGGPGDFVARMAAADVH